MDSRLFARAISKFLSGLVLVGLLLFVPAGTFAYPQAWLLIGILFAPMLIAGLVMARKNPGLLRKRLSAKEEQSEQKAVVALSGMMFLAAFVAADAPQVEVVGQQVEADGFGEVAFGAVEQRGDVVLGGAAPAALVVDVVESG